MSKLSQIEAAISIGMARTRCEGRTALTPDDVLAGCLRVISRLGVVQLGGLLIDLEELGIDWLAPAPIRPARKVVQGAATVALFEHAARIREAEGADRLEMEHLLAALASSETRLMRQIQRTLGIVAGEWRAAVANWAEARAAREASGLVSVPAQYLSPEETAAALGVHVQTVRAYVREGKLRAHRLAGERVLRIRRDDLERLMQPLES
ncbi:MAG: helix-turn-helix domain-containing protein [Bryobacteraceae bacterium]|nr:helix-turn-helix domain-containing protein [Bryobacteraceae bacterium]